LCYWLTFHLYNSYLDEIWHWRVLLKSATLAAVFFWLTVPYLTYKILKHKEQKFILWRLKGVKVLLCPMVNVIQKNTAFFEGYQASDNSSIKTKASAEHWCTDTKSSTQMYSEGNLSQYHFPHHKFHMDLPGIDPGPRRWKAATKRTINPHYIAYTDSVCTVPRTEHSLLPLEKSIGECCINKQSLFMWQPYVRINTRTSCGKKCRVFSLNHGETYADHYSL